MYVPVWTCLELHALLHHRCMFCMFSITRFIHNRCYSMFLSHMLHDKCMFWSRLIHDLWMFLSHLPHTPQVNVLNNIVFESLTAHICCWLFWHADTRRHTSCLTAWKYPSFPPKTCQLTCTSKHLWETSPGKTCTASIIQTMRETINNSDNGGVQIKESIFNPF